MGLQIRDERQLKALTGLSQAQVDHLLPIFSEVYMENQQQKYAGGVASGMRTRKPGGGAKGKRSALPMRPGTILASKVAVPASTPAVPALLSSGRGAVVSAGLSSSITKVRTLEVANNAPRLAARIAGLLAASTAAMPITRKSLVWRM